LFKNPSKQHNDSIEVLKIEYLMLNIEYSIKSIKHLNAHFKGHLFLLLNDRLAGGYWMLVVVFLQGIG